MSTKDTSNW